MKTLIIINPNAGPLHRRKGILRIAMELEKSDPSVEIAYTRKAGDAASLVKQALENGVTRVLCAGGDGTISEAAENLYGTPVSLGILPAGTGNGLAREFGMSFNPKKALMGALNGKAVPVYPGTFNGKKFLLASGAGFDAFVSIKTDREHPFLKKWTGYSSYMVIALSQGFRYPFFPIKIEIDGQEMEGFGLLVLKASARIGPFILAPSLTLLQKKLGAFVFKEKGLFPVIKFVIALFFGRHHALKGCPYYSCDMVRADSLFPVPTQADGEMAAPLPAVWRTSDQSLSLIIPS
ncbi:MAG TPA: diacylglycerol kinase family protein [Nitrospiria bacterium]|nr:diacylglycerol kinase family protein [Nitrospiria bacterium]